MTGHHTVYIGVHVPKSYHRRRRHRRKSSHKEKRERVEHSAEGYKSDVDNVDETSTNILKPLSEWRRRAGASEVNFPRGRWGLGCASRQQKAHRMSVFLE